ncbi:hypothetical protein QE152_g876 [Popillia japonica]|uniref:Uncharacterized protein n=1 Tax=Popillia japonica TaxID=7064 RepID=A0AAW1NA66_POPJA
MGDGGLMLEDVGNRKKVGVLERSQKSLAALFTLVDAQVVVSGEDKPNAARFDKENKHGPNNSQNRIKTDMYVGTVYEKAKPSARTLLEATWRVQRISIRVGNRYRTGEGTPVNQVSQPVNRPLSTFEARPIKLYPLACMYVGSGIEGREKVRQKFANLQSAFIKINDTRRKTCEGNAANSSYYEEMLDILGDTDKVNPVLMLDTSSSTKKTDDEHETTTGVEEEISNVALVNALPNSETEANESVGRKRQNRFASIKSTLKPKPTM